MQPFATILLASAYSCLQLAIDYLYRIEKVYNYLAFFGVAWYSIYAFGCVPLRAFSFGLPPVSLDAGGVFISSSGTYCPRIPFLGKSTEKPICDL